MQSLVNECESHLGLSVDEDFKHLIAAFYSEAVAGTLINVLQNKENYDREAVTRDIVLIFKSSIPAILKSKSEQT